MTQKSLIKVLVPVINPRVQYALDFIGRVVLGLDIKIFDDKNDFVNYEGFAVEYGTSHLVHDAYFINSIDLLFYDNYEAKKDISVEQIDCLPAFFIVPNGNLPIDLPSCVFYLLSRYEEYDNTDLDFHGRYQSNNSLAHNNGFLELPILDLWIERFAISLKNYYKNIWIPFLEDNKRRGSVECTFDIDFPWAYRHLPLAHNIGGAIKDLFRADIKGFSRRMSVILGLSEDPYDQYDFIIEALSKFNLVPRFFLLMRNGTKYDRNHFINNPQFSKLIKKIGENNNLGIHPSYYVIKNTNLLKEELISLTALTAKGIRSSRMHFLRMIMPYTYRMLLDHGIYSDYSMGYADKIGFRSGTSYQHKWFDIEKNEKTMLNIIPLIAMDTTLHTYMSLSPNQAAIKMKEMIEWVQKMKGNSSILWHNNGLSDWNHWEGWKAVFLETIKTISLESPTID